MGNKLGFGSKQPPQSQNSNNFDNVQQEGVQQDFMQGYASMNNNSYNQIGLAPGGSIRLLNEKEQDKGKKVVAVIVTFCTGGSYDSLFTTVEQKSMEGTKVEVYACDSNYLADLLNAFEGKPKDDTAIKLMTSVKAVDPDCVVFNWQCCGGYSGETFQEGNDLVFKFLRKMIDRGHMCMFSDFSLKALVAQWKDKYELGPNPFVKTGEYSGDFQIKFSNAVLKECPSAQLQIVGDMAEGGMCNIHAMGGTIQYCVDKAKTNHKHYTLQALTVVTNILPPKESYISQAGQFVGSAGHVLLKYPSGGMILTSMGHWIELMKIDTSEKKLFEVAQKEYGETQAKKMMAEYVQMDSSMQKEYVQTKAREFVRNQAPCTNMYKKSAW